MDAAFHYPADLLQLLIKTIPYLCPSKPDVLLFFRGAGVPEELLADLAGRVRSDRKSIPKQEIARTVLTRLNEKGDGMLRQRRDVLRRVVEFENFSACWQDDQLPAKGLVADVRGLVNAKDTVTKIANERDADREAARAAKRAEAERETSRRQALAVIGRDLNALFGEPDPHKRGKALEGVLNRVFAAARIQVRQAFTLSDPSGQGIFEQIDGVIQLDGHVYLVEIRWWGEALGPGDVSQHMVRVFSRGQSRGFFISSSGFTPAAIQSCRDALQHAPFVLSELEEIVMLLAQEGDLLAMLRAKVQAAIVDRNPFFLYDATVARGPAE